MYFNRTLRPFIFWKLVTALLLHFVSSVFKESDGLIILGAFQFSSLIDNWG